MTVHHLKTEKPYWQAVALGLKKFEIRKNDRAFQTGDTVRLYCLCDGETKGIVGMSGGYEKLSGYFSKDRRDAAFLEFTIGWMLTGGQHGVEPGYVVFSLEKLDSKQEAA